MKNILFKILIVMCVALPVSAQTLIPATSEDLSDFDRQVTQTLKENNQGREFGQAVAEEAKKLGSAAATNGSAVKAKSKAASGKATKDAKTSSPANNDRGNSSNAPGKTKK
ncbi:hypothetical protein [Bdellovibrio sp. HCB337]|uniref:hypothetical protein n=1 Tax=Bdellovibrio sp. HCB337 TaxID=3394358 RepID=UPI0039A5B323